MSPVGLGKPLAGRESLGSMLSESSTSDEERRRSGSNDRVSPERHDLTAVSVNYNTAQWYWCLIIVHMKLSHRDMIHVCTYFMLMAMIYTYVLCVHSNACVLIHTWYMCGV